MNLRTLLPGILLLAWQGCGLMAAPASPESPDSALQGWASRATAITPTVTKEMGDVGGTHFGKKPDPGKVRRYFVAAELDVWNFIPQGKDVVCGLPLPPRLEAQNTAMKIRYFQYTDETFATRVLPTARTGVMGPVLRGMVGEDLVVTFLNRTQFPLSMHPHGVKYDKDSEGAFYQPNPGLGAAVGPGARFTYVWRLDEQSGPLPGEPSSKGWLYHSHVTSDGEVSLGLMGCIIVTDPRRARPDGTPNDVDREMVSLFMIFNESGMTAAEEEAMEGGPAGAADMPVVSWAEMQERRELGSRYAINGYVFGNLPGQEMNEGERVRWYLFALGDEQDLHTAHWHGLRVVEDGRKRTDVVELLPASMKVADMLADSPGSWLFHCHVAEHMKEGMFAQIVVHPKTAPAASRDPARAFLGVPITGQSMQVDRAEASASATDCEVRIQGLVTVPESFAIFRQPLVLQIGGRSVSITPAVDGKGAAGEVAFRVRNGGKYGVVFGGVMEFEAVLTGATWRAELEKLGVVNEASLVPDKPVQLRINIGEARHAVTLPGLAPKP